MSQNLLSAAGVIGALRVNTDSEHLLTLCMLGNFSRFHCRLLTFFKVNFFKKFFQGHTFRVSYCLDTDQDRHYVSPDLGRNCLQRLSADGKSRRQQGKS